MFVIKHRHRPAAGFEDFDDLLKHLISRIQPLPFFVGRILAMFTDQQHPVNRQRIST